MLRAGHGSVSFSAPHPGLPVPSPLPLCMFSAPPSAYEVPAPPFSRCVETVGGKMGGYAACVNQFVHAQNVA